MSIVDTNGAAVVYYKYDAWGKPISKTGTMAATLGTLNPFRYRGYVFDEETGLYYLRSRYYQNMWDRFINSDCIISENLYCYCLNCPATRYDTNGFDSTKSDGNFDSFLQLVELITNSKPELSSITDKGAWTYLKSNYEVTDYDARQVAINVISIFTSCLEGGIASQITGDFWLSAAIAGGLSFAHIVGTPLFTGDTLTRPNGYYTMESILRRESFGLGVSITESYELFYGNTESGQFYVGLWYWRKTTGPGVSDFYSNVLFEGSFIKQPEVDH